MNRSCNLRDMKMFLSFLCGAAIAFGVTAVGGSNSSHHVYELRMYHVNKGKTEALQARFRDYTDGLFKRHNMKSVGYWVPEDAPASQTLSFTFWSILAARRRRKIGRCSKPIRNGKR
jgi:hypothetical protein